MAKQRGNALGAAHAACATSEPHEPIASAARKLGGAAMEEIKRNYKALPANQGEGEALNRASC